jgi:hypothetical protein
VDTWMDGWIDGWMDGRTVKYTGKNLKIKI